MNLRVMAAHRVCFCCLQRPPPGKYFRPGYLVLGCVSNCRSVKPHSLLGQSPLLVLLFDAIADLGTAPDPTVPLSECSL